MKVVVTGLGCVSSVGGGVDALWQAAVEGRSMLRPIKRFSTEGFVTNMGGEVPDSFPGSLGNWVYEFAKEACRQAVSSSGIRIEDPHRVGVAVGSTLGGKTYADEFVRGHVQPGPPLPGLSLYHSIAGCLADELQIEGPCMTFNVACASSVHAIGYGMEMIRRGRADVMIVGGADHLSRWVFAGFHCLNALTSDCIRPFDVSRDGLLIGDGSGILILEREDRACARGAEILAELRGWGFMEDAVHMTRPDPSGSGMARTICHALQDARMDSSELGYVNAHGTATPSNDAMEARAIRETLGDETPVSSTKPITGHCLGASAAVESIIAIRALKEQTLPPTLNHERPDPEATFDVVPGRARPHKFRAFLKLAAGFGGQNGALIFSSYDG